MRDIDRIKPILGLVEDIWLGNPELSLGQLILGCFGLEDMEDMAYNLEDDHLILRLEKTYLRPNNE